MSEFLSEKHIIPVKGLESNKEFKASVHLCINYNKSQLVIKRHRGYKRIKTRNSDTYTISKVIATLFTIAER